MSFWTKSSLVPSKGWGHSVERIIAQFNEADRYQIAEDEVAQARALAVRLKLEKEALEEEISQGQEGLTGKLKAKYLISKRSFRFLEKRLPVYTVRWRNKRFLMKIGSINLKLKSWSCSGC